jgi:DNA-binding MarR family transcriptional regulator
MEPLTTPCICTTLRMTTRAINRAYDQALAPAGLRQTGYSILSRLDAEGPFSIGELATRLAMERSTCSREVAPLVRAGLVESDVGDDRRARVHRLSQAGRRRLDEARPLWNEVQRQITAAIGAEQVDELLAGVRDLFYAGGTLAA